VIGNDIVDLVKAKQESNIFRPRYLEKVCSPEEIDLVLSSSNAINTFWRIWTMKESAYKAFQRDLSFKTFFNPFAFTCQFKDSDFGELNYNGHQLSTKTIQTKEFIYSEVVNFRTTQRFFGSSSDFLKKLKTELNLKSHPELTKTKDGLPVLDLAHKMSPISKTHHGNFQAFQY
jgi:phosphopantetheinyl transferase (holo-ACP synthase)